MPVVLELPAIAGIYVLIGVLFVVAYTFTLLAHALNVSVFGTHPFASLARVIENTIVNGCKDGIDTLEHFAVRMEGFLADAFQLLLALFILPFAGLNAALAYLWHSLVKPLIADAAGGVRTLGNEALATAKAAERTIAREVARIDHAISTGIKAAEHAAHTFTVQEVTALERTVSGEISELRDLIPRAIHDAAAAEDVITGRAIDALREAENAAIGSIAAAERVTADELHALLGNMDLTQLAGLIAAVPLLSALVTTIATESGLDSANCRAKVKNICATDPNAWGNLLGGLAAMTIAFNLRELIEFGNEMVGLLEPEIRAIEAA